MNRLTLTEAQAATIRTEFPVAEGLVYLDNAAAALVPRVAAQAMTTYYAGVPHNAGVELTADVYYGGVGEFAESVTAQVTRARAEVAALIGARPGEIVFTKNTTEALNLIPSGLPLEAGDEVILSDVEHQAAALPWIRLAGERGIRLSFVQATRQGYVDPDAVEAKVSPATKAIALIHVSSLFGAVEPVEAVGAIARGHGLTFIVDAAQSVGRIPVNVEVIGCDFLALCGRKGPMGPQGIGALYGRAECLARLRPLTIGSRSAVLGEDGNYALAPPPFRFEAGALNAAGVIGLGASVAFLRSLGMEVVRRRIEALGAALWAEVSGIERVVCYGDPLHVARTGILSFNVEGLDSREVCRRLWKAERVIVSPGIHGSPMALRKVGARGTVRASVHCFNTCEEIKMLARGLRAVAAGKGR